MRRISSDVCWAAYLLSDLISSYSRLAKLRGFLVAEAGSSSSSHQLLGLLSGPHLGRAALVCRDTECRAVEVSLATCTNMLHPVIPQYRGCSLMHRVSKKVEFFKMPTGPLAFILEEKNN